jgi:alpha-beta hydrolase superfamily lysophospholipase
MRALAILCLLLVASLCGAVLAIGMRLARPDQTAVGPPPPELDATSVTFPSDSGARLHGWLAPGRPGGGIVVLMHGIHANRTAMQRRAIVLHQHGFAVLLFDFQAQGESVGRHITFGHLEALDAASAVTYARIAAPGERVGAIGVSLGGAAALLGRQKLAVDALVLESVYSDFDAALANRLAVRLGPFVGAVAAPVLTPVFEMLMWPILGVPFQALDPTGRIGAVTAPLLVMSGSNDADTPIAEARDLFEHATAPKQFWAVQGAAHVDLERYDAAGYWARVLPFLTTHLQRPPDQPKQ